MTTPAWLTAAGLAASLQPPPPSSDASVVSAYAGEFSAAPAPMWVRRLPGDRVPSAVHTESGGPLLYGDHIFTGTAGEDSLLVLHRSDGRLLRRLPARGVVRCPPVIQDGQLIYSDAGGATWSYRLEGDRPAAEPTWVHVGNAPVLAAPAVSGGRVVVADVSNVVVSLDAATGELEWRHAQKLDPGRSSELELYGHPSPTLADDAVLAGFADGTLVSLDPDRGEIQWQRRVGEGQYPDVVASPLLLGGDVLASGFTAPLVSLDRASQSVRWRLDDVGAAHGATLAASPDGQRLLHAGVDGILRAVDPMTGAVIWEWDSKQNSALTQPVVTAAGALVGAASGSLYLVDVTTGERTWEWTPGYHIAGITAQPAVEGRQLVAVTNEGNIVSLVVPAPPAQGPARPLLDHLDL